MSITRPSSRSTATAPLAAAAVLAAAVLLGGGVAAADPPALNRPTCAATLAQAATWPGTQGHGYRYVSDRYVSYLSGQPECAPDLTTG